MIHEALAVAPSHVVAVEATTPSPESPAGEATMPAPTSEQAQAADRVFTTASDHPHPAATIMGVLTSAMLLRDIAVDTFSTSDEEEEAEKNKDANPTRTGG